MREGAPGEAALPRGTRGWPFGYNDVASNELFELNRGTQGADGVPAPALSDDEIKSRMRFLGSWQLEHGELVRTFTFVDFRASLAFVNQVGELAEAAGHHPDIDIRYNKVRLALVTHDAGGLTAKDFDLAGEMNELQK